MRVLIGAGLVFVWATPVILAIDLWQWMFDYEFGVINCLLTRIGAGNFIHHNWFEQPGRRASRSSRSIVVWGAIPFVAITLFAGAARRCPRTLVEAARDRRRARLADLLATSPCRCSSRSS